MADNTAIEWTTATWNPTTGCDRVSPGCDNCYALAMARRLKAMGVQKYQRDGNPRTSGPGFGLTMHSAALALPSEWKTPRLIFVNSMSDLFHEQVTVEFIQSVLDVAAAHPQHGFQILTKRSRRLRDLAPGLDWPDNVWMGVSIESDRYAFRAEHLRDAQGPAIKFLSLEPLLGSIDNLELKSIDWVIVGGESGARARPLRRAWVRSIKRVCREADVPFFFKQWGGRYPKERGRVLDQKVWNELPRGIPQALANALS